MLSIRKSILIRALLNNRIPSSSTLCTFVPQKLRKMSLLPENSLASHENQYFRWQVEASEPTVLHLTLPVPTSVQNLEQIWKQGESLESPNHVDLVKDLVNELPLMAHESVIHVLHLLSNMRKSRHDFDNQNQVWYAIDSVLIRDHKKAERTSKQLSATLDHSVLLSTANPGRIPRLVANLNGSLLKRLPDLLLDKERLLKFLFNLNLARNPLPFSAARFLENEVLKYVDDMTMEEVGLVAATFFKTQTKIQSPELVMKFVEKMADKRNRSPDKFIAMSSLFKILRYQILAQTVDHVRDLIDSFTQDELRQMSPMALNHLCRLATAYHKHSPLLIGSAIESLSASIRTSGERIRFKDVVEILRSCDDFCYAPDPGLMNQIISCWPSAEEVTQYPNYYISYLSVLAALGHYPVSLIEKCFSRQFLRHAKETCTPFPHIALLSLHTILSINCHPKFESQLLRPHEVEDSVREIRRVDISLLLDSKSRGDTFTIKCLRRLFWRCKEQFGQRTVFMFVLPYLTHPDIIILPEGQDVLWLKTRKLVPGSFDGCTIVLLESRQHFADYGTSVPRNFFAKKKQLLQKLGFQLLLIHFSDMRNASDVILDQYLSKLRTK